MLIKNHPNKNENTKTSFGTHKQSPKKLYKVGYSVYVFQQQYTARFYFIFFLVCKNAKNPKIKQPTCDFVLVYFFAFTSSIFCVSILRTVVVGVLSIVLISNYSVIAGWRDKVCPVLKPVSYEFSIKIERFAIFKGF